MKILAQGCVLYPGTITQIEEIAQLCQGCQATEQA